MNKPTLPRSEKRNIFRLLILSLLICASISARAQTSGYVTTDSPYKWKAEGQNFEWSPYFLNSDYMYYRSLSKTIYQSNELTRYANEHSSHPYLQQLAAKLNQPDFTSNQMVVFLTAFVQSIPYVSDPVAGRDYVRYPIETMLEGGDCEDKAILLVTLLKLFDCDAVLIDLPGHVAVGLWSVGNIEWYYTFNNRNYAFIETTTPGWPIGAMDSRFQYSRASILVTPDIAVYNRGTFDPESTPTTPLATTPPKLVVPPTPIPTIAGKTSTSSSSVSITVTCSAGASTYVSVTNAGTTTVKVNGITVQTQSNTSITTTVSVVGNTTTINVTGGNNMNSGGSVINNVNVGNVGNNNGNNNGRPR